MKNKSAPHPSIVYRPASPGTMPYKDKKFTSPHSTASWLLLLILAALTGCQQVPVYEQVDLSRPGMLFSDSPALSDASAILSTIEPGTDDRGGANAAGCTACQ